MAVPTAAHVAAQIGIEGVPAPAERHVQHAVVLTALVLGSQFAVDLQAALAQAFPGPWHLDGGGVLTDPQQTGRNGQLLGLDLHVPEQTAGGLRKPLERARQQPSVLRRKEPCRDPLLTVRTGQEFRVERFPPLVAEPFGGHTAHGDQQLRAPGRRRSGLPQ